VCALTSERISMAVGIMVPYASLSPLTVVFDLGSFDLHKAVQALVAGRVHHCQHSCEEVDYMNIEECGAVR
jgi:hypothetical protein